MTTVEETKHLAPWTDEIPSDWSVVRLDTAADVLFSNVDKHSIEGETPVRLCNYVDVYKNDRITGNLNFMEATADDREIQKFQLRQGDVLATKDSEEWDDIAIPAFVNDELPGVLCGYHLALIRPRLKILDGSYLAWLQSSKPFRAQYEARAVGVTRFGLSQYTFRAARIPLPPLPEQRRIAAFLDASCAAIDAAIAAKRQQIETLDELRYSKLYQILTRGLNDSIDMEDSGLHWLRNIPSHWRVRRIKDIAELRSGDGIEAENISRSGDYPVFGGNGLRGYTSSFTHDGDYVLIGRQGALCGNINYAKGKFWATEHAVVATPIKDFDRVWFGEMLRIMNLNQYSNAAAQPGLAADRIKFLRLPVPPRDEQTRLSVSISAVINKTEELASHLENQISTLTSYRKSLIHECVTGRRRITGEDVQRVQNRCPVA